MVVEMKDSVTVSAKVNSSFRKKMAQLGISPSEVIKRALAAEVADREKKILRKKVEEAGHIIMKVPKEDWVRGVRESRDKR
jgi:phenylpyruvate tautomerase PptA (4-oxalocrotonate tautomerase family)